VKKKKVKRMIFVIMVAAFALSCIGFLACGGGGNSDEDSDSAEETATTSSQKTDKQSQEDKQETSQPSSTIPDDWKTHKCQGWSLSFPNTWSGDQDAGLWWPGEGGIEMGRPALSVHCGGIPLMPGTGFEDRVKSHIHGEPMERKNVSVSGISGFVCSWEFTGNKHLGIFLEEKVGSGVSVIHFVDCQAPLSDFDIHKSDFEKIITSLNK